LLSDNITYGPVPSRRLGRSLGVNNIHAKCCSYSCLYCQVGSTLGTSVKRRCFQEPIMLGRAVKERLDSARQSGDQVDYLSFVPDGEPTLDKNLGREIELLKALGVKIAVITNASLIWDEGVRQSLAKADWVSLKVDSVKTDTWTRMNRPHNTLKLEDILDGITVFARQYKGSLNFETMLVEGVNDSMNEFEEIASFVYGAKPAKCYLGIPTRPPAEKIGPAGENALVSAFNVFACICKTAFICFTTHLWCRYNAWCREWFSYIAVCC